MRNLRPEQLLLLLVFVLVPFVNLLVRWLRGRTHNSGQGLQPPEPEERKRRPVGPMPRIRLVEPPVPPGGPRRAPLPPPPEPAPLRAAPLGGLPAIRRAVVMMTILGPCRALEEPSPSTAVRRSPPPPPRRP